MNERDYGKELDEMKAGLAALAEQVSSMQALLTASASELKGMGERKRHGFDGRNYVGHVVKTKKANPDPHVTALMDECEDRCGEENDVGCVSYLGVFASGGNQSNWAQKNVSGNDLLALAENGTAEKVLACVGSREKLKLLTALLRKPSTVHQLVEKLGFGSTGQVYHHLKPLLAANLVEECAERVTEKGWYEVVPHRVQGIVMLLCGILDLTDGSYSLGRFDGEES